MVFRRLPFLGVFRALGDVAFERRPQDQRTRRLVEGADAHQHAAHVGMHDDRVGRLLRKFRAGQRPPGEPLLGVGCGVLIGDLG